MIFPIVIGLGILSIFLLFILLKKNKILSDYHLIALILFFAGILGSQVLIENWPSVEVYIIIHFFNSYYLPVLTIYGLILLDGQNRFKAKWLWLYIYPFIYSTLLLLDVLVFNDYKTTSEIEALFFDPSDYQSFFHLSQYVYVIIVTLWLWKRINNYTTEIKNYHSSIENINLNWFRYFTLALLCHSIFGFLTFTSFTFDLVSNIEIAFGIEYIIFVFLMFYLCYHGIRQYSIAEFRLHAENNFQNVENELTAKEKYQSSTLDQEGIDSYFNEILRLFEEEKLFLEPQLKIEDLAKRVDITIHKASQVINSKSDKSFYEFVNQYRVEHFKKLLADPEKRKFTILSLGIESGFNSKASMNRVFKNFEGQSPKEFQQSI